MGEVEEEEQKFVCKFCNKICSSGKSLGGHMRCHLPLIAASRKKVKVQADINMDCENYDHGDCGYEEKPNFTSKNRILEMGKNCRMNHEIWDQDQDSYILRENPKKSRMVSDLRIKPYNKEGIFCKECSKKFPSSRALAGHMRTHSTKGKRKVKHLCRECDKGFDSMKAMFGHMKIHSKKSSASTESDGLSELEFCYPKQKRSVTKYRMSESNSVSSAKELASVIEIDEADADAAVCLILLSTGLREWATNAISSESFDKGITKIDTGDFLCDIDEIENPIQKPKTCLIGSLNSVPDHNLSEPLCFLDKKTELMMSQQEGASCADTDSCSEMLKDPGKKREYKCKICNMIFNCHQALGGHSNRHKMMISSSTEINLWSDNQSSETPIEAGSSRMALAMTDFEVIRSQEHECQICFKIFSTGQALGGHKRAHSNTLPNEDRMKEIMVENQGLGDIQHFLDLNLPVSSQIRS